MKEKRLTKSWQKSPTEAGAFWEAVLASSINQDTCFTRREEKVASPGVTETPARSIGELTGEIVARFELLLSFETATAARN